MTEEKVLALNSSRQSYHYCYCNQDADVKLHEDVIINNKDPFYAYHFAKDIIGANIERLQEIIINFGSLYYIYNFAYIEKSNKEELFKAMLKSGDKEYINHFIKNIPLPKELKELTIFI